ncbi:MAG: DUF6624 domain-containing protein [Fimbriimonas sp.]
MTEESLYPGIREELRRRFREDQDARAQVGEAMRNGASEAEIAEIWQDGAVDRANTAWLKSVVDRIGWPGIPEVGTEGAECAWTLVQHADRDRPFQRQCLDLMRAKMATGEVEKRAVAYLTDRVLVGAGERQIYGTQMMSDGNGGWIPRPVEDPDNLEQRRAEAGLETMAEYAIMMERCHGRS